MFISGSLVTKEVISINNTIQPAALIKKEVRATILIVDDTPENVMVLSEILRPDYKVKAATNGEQALKIAHGDNPPDMILLDVMMPGIDGFEVCRRLKGDPNTQFIPIVMVTALNGLQDRVQALEVGADDFLSKPVEPSEVKARVRSLLRLKKMHDELQSSYEQLQELQALRENLTHMIIHDMRTPLTSVIGSLWSMLEFGEFEPGSPLLELQEMAVSGSDKLLTMINDLLDITKMESGQMVIKTEAVPLEMVAADAEVAVATLARLQNLALKIEIPSDLPPLSADRELLRRVLVNLIGNSIKFTPYEGSVTVSAQIVENNMVKVLVTDTGYGIPPEYHGKIFEKFGQVAGRSENKKFSTGLGLTFCKMAVEAHGGAIGCRQRGRPGQHVLLHLARGYE